MERVPITRLKAELARYLTTLKAGRPFLVTDRGRPVAVFEPMAFDRFDDATKTLVMTGLVRPPERELPMDFYERPGPKDPEGRVLAYLLEERAYGR
ncbi:type II toxin-antitoxin system Phd/YefM family antitoxin [Aquisphaera insulae]|uniref:type II toxin-antitoxin system Phd/YefM family antitoxin n=1 Tax=Aquisphaera insulae TaxID=2712864 RepID=UPI0013EAD7FE|nr:type II toxin-antitoxin system Phd/YefM family antitoxin [Aquisphaera insulae]